MLTVNILTKVVIKNGTTEKIRLPVLYKNPYLGQNCSFNMKKFKLNYEIHC